MAGRRPRTPTNEERLAEDLERVRANDPKMRFVDWASREVTDDQLSGLCEALAHNNYLRKLHLSFNPGITNVGSRLILARRSCPRRIPPTHGSPDYWPC